MEHNLRSTKSDYKSYIINVFYYGFLVGFAVILPLVLRKFFRPIIGFTYGFDYGIFELFGFSCSLVTLVIVYTKLRKQPVLSLEKAIEIVLPVLVCFFFLIQVVEHSNKSRDYERYEQAAKAVIAKSNLYENTNYFYPPFTAQIMALTFKLFRSGILFLNLNHQKLEYTSWQFVFYLFQCMQFFLVILSYFLCYRFACKVNLTSLQSLIIVTTLFLFNNSLIRTLSFNQVNLYVLTSILIAVLCLPEYPIVSGLALAIGTHIKLYPLLIGIVLFFAKKRIVLLWTIIGACFILLIQTRWGQNWQLWSDFLVFFTSSFPKDASFRNNSLHSFSYNIVSLISYFLKLNLKYTSKQLVAQIMVFIESFFVIVWFGIRFILRERMFHGIVNQDKLSINDKADFYRICGHVLDGIGIMLLLSPMVWEHHYIISLPIAIWSISIMGRDKPWQVGTSMFLIYVLPTFDVFPFSYHRVVGLVMLVCLIKPEQSLFISRLGLKNEHC
ncbi:MAG: hypothetical protein A2043_11100 [Candidatus Schekmanbacteria bacterium GWA2_38_9]|uniref:DUF2029 domain-containing protein n=1 Tax=Candidatus Schekmanbacteria bacterium RIFCSPLOWO2_12_FULL_38_15 TaxID=1817883 RepID=A0A1F7SDY1_9BACT|nr:MAG: hypothetical protein A2043_11100 [Candidatus Schekmanbacteria bacterium GWA2_38_9]OGL49892.1 MAG: hypothetical protein A3H37_09805 [Candidatus Schekmanbacteria bacterium RIFCSPLOWO2_02_FULL_38_14]OGL51931.1 MAG: hypothetical protein A3G31_09750 [Candidatus Schekmanbacteria bacterium RIFCSPLOWO2_12_FULL_38_15]